MATTWNPADKHADITLSNGDLTTFSTVSSSKSLRSTAFSNSGKWYWELTAITVSYDRVGIATSTFPLDYRLGDTSAGISYGYDVSGQKRHAGVVTDYGDSWGPGDIIGIALDLDNGKIWFSKNGVWQASGDPGAGTNEAFSGVVGTFYPAFSPFWVNNEADINFGATNFAYTIPTGFSPFDVGIDSDITTPSLIVEGFTGITAILSTPMSQAEGFTGIDARDVTNPAMTVEGFTGIYSALSAPMQTVIMTGSDNMVHTESFITIPSMSVAITQAKQIWGNISAPMMTAEITERETVLGNVTVPMMTVELASGVHADIEVTISMMTAEGEFSKQCEVAIPMMTVEVEGIVGRVINSDIRLPMVTVEMTGKTEHLIDCDVSVPKMRVVADLMTGKIITGAATIPMMEAALTSYEDITGDIDAFVPMLEAYMVATAERAECAVLRYAEPVL